MDDFDPEDDGGLSECERAEWEFQQAQLLLANDPASPLWLDYVQEQSNAIH